MRVAIVSTYPPRPCGIGTFARDVRQALIETDPSVEVDVLSIVRDQNAPTEPEVLSVIRQEVRADYVAAPALLDARGTDVVLIEHEYGIFGGNEGAFVLSLVKRLRQPFVVTLHTVLSEPTVAQLTVLGELCQRATLVTVFTETARRMVVDSAVAPAALVRVVPHGAPTALLPPRPNDETSPPAPRATIAHLEGRTVLSTFGLISAGKGVEIAIKALPAIRAQHPDVLYLVAGQTHPEVVKSEGERYRLSLQRLVRDLDLERNVQFLDHFLSTEELASLLASTDLYLTPYRSREQIVSGALTFAVVAGCPVVSTPYFYAEDLLSSGAGVLVPFDDPDAFAAGALKLLNDPNALVSAAREARRIGAGLAWPAVGAQTMDVLHQAQQLWGSTGAKPVAASVASSPTMQTQHLLTLVDDVGILQHADGVVPNRSSGYCVDDMARLVMVGAGLDRDPRDQRFNRIVTLGLSFLRHAWDPVVGGMHNVMSYDRRWLDGPHSGDHLGRAVWALGVVIAAHPPRAVVAPSLRLLEEIAPVVERMDSLRAMGFAALGLSRPPLQALPPILRRILETLAARLLDAFKGASFDDWHWFEGQLTYDNARLPQALIAAGHRLDDSEMVVAGLDALNWYRGQCMQGESVIRLIGNRWRTHTIPAAAAPADDGDEQPLDAAALVEALTEALAVTGRSQYGDQAVRIFEWFLGRNRRGEPVYDFATGGCHDGLGPHGLSDNEGAESTLAYFQAVLALEAAGLLGSLPQA